MKKPVRKRKGYDSGGIVSAGRRLYGQMSDIASDRAQQDAATQAGLDRYQAKDYPGMYTNFQRADIVGDRMKARQGFPTTFPKDQPEGYPTPGYTHAKGGKVTKVLKRKRR